MKLELYQKVIINFFKFSFFIILIPLSMKLSFYLTDNFILSGSSYVGIPAGAILLFLLYVITFLPITVGIIIVLFGIFLLLLEKVEFFERVVFLSDTYSKNMKALLWLFITLFPYMVLLIGSTLLWIIF